MMNDGWNCILCSKNYIGTHLQRLDYDNKIHGSLILMEKSYITITPVNKIVYYNIGFMSKFDLKVIYIEELKERIALFQQHISRQNKYTYIQSDSPIQCLIVPGNEAVTQLSTSLQKEGYDVRPIRKPTVPAGKERIRICLHRHNSFEEIERLIQLLN